MVRSIELVYFRDKFLQNWSSASNSDLLETVGPRRTEDTLIIRYPAQHNRKQYGNDLANCWHFVSGGSSVRFAVYIDVAHREKIAG